MKICCFSFIAGDDIVNDVDELNAGGNEALAVNQLRRTLGNCEYQGFDTMYYHHYRVG